jgi:Protein of unknown function (DUF3237)
MSYISRSTNSWNFDEALKMELELLFEITAQIAPPILIPDTPDGTRVVVHVTGGKFEGPPSVYPEVARSEFLGKNGRGSNPLSQTIRSAERNFGVERR